MYLKEHYLKYSIEQWIWGPVFFIFCISKEREVMFLFMSQALWHASKLGYIYSYFTNENTQAQTVK